jgi:hypothetical protein
MIKNSNGQWVIRGITDLFGWQINDITKSVDDDEFHVTVTIEDKETGGTREAKIHVMDVPLYAFEMKRKK